MTARPLSRDRGDRSLALFAGPQVALILVFVFWPLIMVVRYSTTRYDGLSDPIPVGDANYRFLADWSDFHRIVANNVLLLGGLVVWVIVPFVLAVLVFPMRAAPLVRAVLYVPAMLPPIIVGGVFRIVLADQGPVNTLLRSVGLGAVAPGWFTDERFVLVTVVLVIGWATMGSGVLFYSAGLAAISPSYIEAALIDGASRLQMMWHIYRPALAPITQFWVLLLTVTTVTGFFPWIYGLTQGGPGVASTTLDYAVYITLNQGSQLGRGAAIAVVTLVFVALIVVVQRVLTRLLRQEAWS